MRKINKTVQVLVRVWKQLYQNCYARLSNLNIRSTRTIKQDALIINIRKAKTDLDQSKHFFANVSDPDLVDYAAHKILAYQSYYTYLLKKAKAEKVSYK